MFTWLRRRNTTPAPEVAVPGRAPAMDRSPSEIKRVEGNALLEGGQLELAAQAYHEAVRLDDGSVPARVNLAYVLLELQRPAEAEIHLLRAVAVGSSNVDALYMLGGAARARGDLDVAVGHFLSAISVKADFEPAYRDACLAFVESGQVDRAESLLRQGLQSLPSSADLHFLLGNALQLAGQLDDAVQAYKQALALRPDHVEAHSNIVLALRSLGRLGDAVTHLQRIAAFRPSDFDAHLQYGVALQGLERHDDAVNAFRKAVEIDPRSPVGLSSLGAAFAALGRADEAIAHYQLAIAADETHYFAHAGLGVQFNEKGRPLEAVESLRKALVLKPGAIEPHSNLLFLMSFVAPPDEYLDEAREFGMKVHAHAGALAPHRAVPTGGPLRVGLVSGDLRSHPVASFLESVLTSLDREKVEVVVFATANRDDDVTTRLRRLTSDWLSIVGMGDEAAARAIQGRGIDVLIDLAGHTAHNRLPVFAWKPAPVQVSWLGYLASTGLSSIDYVLADRVSTPEEDHKHFVERVWYMPNSLYCFTAPADAPEVGRLPALALGHVTFGSFQRMNKISDETLQAWAAVIRAVPNARLRLQSKQMADPRGRAHALERLERAGVEVDRVVLAGPIPDRRMYLSSHDHVDIVLDTFPYCGITTTCEALWMGVPTVTLTGNSLLSRQGASLLCCVGLDDWVAVDVADYVERAVRHAGDLHALTQLRAGLRDRARASALFDAPRFARDLEQALRGMWLRYAAAQHPEDGRSKESSGMFPS